MEFNQLTRICADIQSRIDALQQSERQVTDELQWYRSIAPSALTENLRRNEATVEKLRSEILSLEKEIEENAARLGEVVPVIGTLFNSFNWFAKDQVDRKRLANYRLRCSRPSDTRIVQAASTRRTQ
jgi:hypothetical protein